MTLDERLERIVLDWTRGSTMPEWTCRLREDLGADEPKVAELFMLVEEEFGITVYSEDAGSLLTLEDVRQYVARQTV